MLALRKIFQLLSVLLFRHPFPIRRLRHVTWLSFLSRRVCCAVTTFRFQVLQVTFSAQFRLRFAPAPHGSSGFLLQPLRFHFFLASRPNDAIKGTSVKIQHSSLTSGASVPYLGC